MATLTLAPLPPKPKISVVTVCLNHAEFIRANIESVLAQKYDNVEHLIVDGGSTDGTIEILRSYPHLSWTSEKDRNQSDALNKGFARSAGDIIVWLNSDDFLAPGVFDEIVPALREHAVVLTKACETDRAGKPAKEVENEPRTFFDILKFWIPFAWLGQVGVFFRRELLEAARLPGGAYLDEGYNFCMDVDLFLRMAHLAPFTRRIDRVGAYFRMYETNKTGLEPHATQKEFARVYRRHCHLWSGAEREISFVLPISEITPELTTTLNSLLRQELRNFDVLLVDGTNGDEQAAAMRQVLTTLDESVNVIGFRRVRSRSSNSIDCLNTGLDAARAALLVSIFPGDSVAPDFTARLTTAFSSDPLGLAIPAGNRPELQGALLPQSGRINTDEFFSDLPLTPHLAVRRLAYLEAGPLPYPQIPSLSVRAFALKLASRGWHLQASPELSVESHLTKLPQFAGDPSVLGHLLVAQLASDIAADQSASPFQKVRERYGFTVPLPPDLPGKARQLLSVVPQRWWEILGSDDEPTLRQAAQQYPALPQTWFFLARRLAALGNQPEAAAALERYRELAQDLDKRP